MEKEFELFLNIAPILKDILQEDIAVTVMNTSTVIAYYPGKTIDMPAKVGEKFPPMDDLINTLKDGKIRTSYIPKNALGIPFKGTVYPIKSTKGEIIGLFRITKSLKKEVELEDAAKNIFGLLSQTDSNIKQMAEGSQILSSSLSNIIKSTDITKEKIKETDSVLDFIKSISTQSNLLALNTSIEAARVGELGKGFAVVSGEMKKLAQMSGESVKKVSQTLLEMRQSIDDIIDEINNTSNISISQTEITKQITDTLVEVVSDSKTLVNVFNSTLNT